MRILIAIIAVMVAGTANAQIASCPRDLSATSWNHRLDAGLPIPAHVTTPCFGGEGVSCRRVDTHVNPNSPTQYIEGYYKDFRNAMLNYMNHGNGLDQTFTVDVPGLGYVERTFCNAFGQCLTAIAEMDIVMSDMTASIGIGSGPASVGVSLGTSVDLAGLLNKSEITGMRIKVITPEADVYESGGTRLPGQMGSDAEVAAIPSDAVRDDFVEPGTICIDTQGYNMDPLPENMSWDEFVEQFGDGGSVTLNPGESVGGGSGGSPEWHSKICQDIEGNPYFCP